MPKNRSVRYIDFGYLSAREEWEEVGLPAYEMFRVAPSRATAMNAAVHAWHAQDWIWHENNPGIDTHGNAKFNAFRRQLIEDCPELEWVGDIADAAKHRGLGRPNPPQVQRMNPAVPGRGVLMSGGKVVLTGSGAILLGGVGLTIELTDGSQHAMADVLASVIEFWRAHFEKAPL